MSEKTASFTPEYGWQSSCWNNLEPEDFVYRKGRRAGERGCVRAAPYTSHKMQEIWLKGYDSVLNGSHILNKEDEPPESITIIVGMSGKNLSEEVLTEEEAKAFNEFRRLIELRKSRKLGAVIISDYK